MPRLVAGIVLFQHGLRITALAVKRPNMLGQAEIRVFGTLQPEIPVFIDCQAGIKVHTMLQQSAIKQCGMNRDEVVAAQHSPIETHRNHVVTQLTIRAGLTGGAVDDLALGMLCSRCEQLFYMRVRDPVIIIEKQQVVTGCMIKSGVGGFGPIKWLAEIDQLQCDMVFQRYRAGETVTRGINQHQLYGRPALSIDGFERLCQRAASHSAA